MIKTDVFVSVCYHKRAAIVKSEILQPIQVGASLSETKLDFAIQDNDGINISHKNKAWCELTAAHWMRHNVDAEYYGLMHYRRLLSFSKKITSDRSFTLASDADYRKFGWNDDTIRASVADADILTPPMYPTFPVGLPNCVLTNYDMYARDHHSADMDVCLEVCRAQNADIFPYFLQTLKDNKARFGNLYVMRRDLFHEYSDWMLPILREVEKQIDKSEYDSYQSRVIGFLAERMTEAYFRFAETVRGAKLEERRIAFAAKPPHPANTQQALDHANLLLSSTASLSNEILAPINIAYSIDEGYAQHTAASLHSVLLNADTPDRYRCFIFHKGDLSADTREKLKSVATPFGAQVSFVEIPVESLLWLPMNRPHVSLTTYYRLVMHEFLPEHVDRIIYLDADTLATSALEALWNTDMDENVLAAAPDEGGVLQSRRLRLSISHKYFNAGVLLLDIDGLRKMDMKSLLMKAFEQYGEFITLQDQDLLNIAFECETLPLNLRWNVNNRIYTRNELEPTYSDGQAAEAAADPGILHFTDSRKPWHTSCYNPFYSLYWFHRNQTPWREKRIQQLKRRLLRMLWRRMNLRYRKNLVEAKSALGEG